MEIKRFCFLKEVGVGRDLEAGGRASGREKEGCFERQQEKNKGQDGKRAKKANGVIGRQMRQMERTWGHFRMQR